jgi:hydrogenase-4 component F
MIFGVFIVLGLLSVVFYKFVHVYQEGMSGEAKEVKVYKNEIIGLLLFVISLIVLILPQTFEYIEGIVK